MLKLINHIVKKELTHHSASIHVIQFTQNCAAQIATPKNTYILNNSELLRISDLQGLSLSQCIQCCLLAPQVPTTISDVRASGVFDSPDEPGALPRCLCLGEGCPPKYAQCVVATRKNWWYQWVYSWCNFILYSKFQVVAGINRKSNNGKFNHQYKLLGEKRRGNWVYKINAEKNSSQDINQEWKLYRSILGNKYRYTSLELAVRRWARLCIRGLLWARLPCSIGIGDKLSWGNLSTTSGRSLALNSPKSKISLF